MTKHRSLILLFIVAVLMIIPMFIGGEFAGTDDQASKVIEAIKPGYQPWFSPLWEPPSGEIASLLFALQAALGAGVIGYAIGRKHEKTKNSTRHTMLEPAE